jgi:hypothetical protein
VEVTRKLMEATAGKGHLICICICHCQAPTIFVRLFLERAAKLTIKGGERVAPGRWKGGVGGRGTYGGSHMQVLEDTAGNRHLICICICHCCSLSTFVGLVGGQLRLSPRFWTGNLLVMF